MKSPSCWVVTDGKAGMENQCLGLAEALGINPLIKHVNLRNPWRLVTPFIRPYGTAQFTSESAQLSPPWPDLLIATGRHSIAASILVKKRSGGVTRTVQLQDPVIAPKHFDLVVVPRHDKLRGPNVIATRGALHRVTPLLLRNESEKFRPRFAHLKHPFIGVLIGGSNNVYRLGPQEMNALVRQLADAATRLNASLLITPSRRTSEETLSVLRSGLAQIPHFLWDGTGDNPYFGFLGLADFLVVTCDSVNMVSEAASTGKPVYVADLPGGSPKFERFHHALREEGITRPFAGVMEPYSYAPLDDVAMVAKEVKALLRI